MPLSLAARPTLAPNVYSYPILHLIPEPLQRYPSLTVLVISMLTKRLLIQAVMKARPEALSLAAAYPDASTIELATELGVTHSTLRNLLSEAY